jgi:hypothetical protein
MAQVYKIYYNGASSLRECQAFRKGLRPCSLTPSRAACCQTSSPRLSGSASSATTANWQNSLKARPRPPSIPVPHTSPPALSPLSTCNGLTPAAAIAELSQAMRKEAGPYGLPVVGPVFCAWVRLTWACASGRTASCIAHGRGPPFPSEQMQKARPLFAEYCQNQPRAKCLLRKLKDGPRGTLFDSFDKVLLP